MPIYDQGYQHWHGKLSGHAWRWWAITRQGVRVQMQNRFTRIVMFAAWMPAIALAVALTLWGLVEQQSEALAPLVDPILNTFDLPIEMVSNPTEYREVVWTLAYHFFFQVQLFLAMILVLLVGPNLISQDLRFNALPLYLSRPLTRMDYFLGKLGVIGVCLGAVIIVPAVIAYFLGVLFSLDIKILVDTFPVLLGSLAYGVVIVLSTGTLMLGLSSLSRSSRYVGAFWIGVWFISSAVATTLSGIHLQSAYMEASLAELEIQREMSTFRERPRRGPIFKIEIPPKQRKQPDPEKLARLEARLAEAQAKLTDAIQNNWYPLFSYASNLERLERAFLNTNAAWDKLIPLSQERDEFSPGRLGSQGEPIWLTEVKGPQYPWYWSAGVLVGLMGLSVWILNRRIRSLDRLK